MTRLLQEASELLAERRFQESLGVLNRVNAGDCRGMDVGKYYLLKGEVLLHLGNYTHTLIEDALRMEEVLSEPSLFAHAKYLLGWKLHSTGEPLKAKEPLLESYCAFQASRNYGSAARSLNRLAMISFQAGEIGQAVENLSKSIAYYDRAGNKRLRDSIHFNLALVYFMSGQLRESLRVYEELRRTIDEIDDKTRSVYKLGSAMAYALTGQRSKAEAALRDAQTLTEKFKREKAQYYEYLGWTLILDQDFDASLKALEAGLGLSMEIAPESALISQTKRLMGDAYFATGKLKKASRLAEQALVVAEKINERVEIAACYRIFAQVEQCGGTADKAREWYKKALEILNLINSRYELAVTRYLAAESGLFPQGEAMAMFHLAREYFESERIDRYLEKVDSAMSRPISSYTRPVRRSSGGCPTIITVNDDMKKLVDLAEHVAQSEMTVFLTGETGTGKDLFARNIHFCSGRSGEFVTVNAAAIPNPMIEAELFGHTKGAFTSADGERRGLIEQADNGTFYLNEIADATPEFQAKLLEVLETREVRRLGSNQSRKVNFRLIAATNHDLKARMHGGQFRVDLYHRLNEIPLTLPPLSARKEDIPALVAYFLGEAGHAQDGDEVQRLAGLLALQEYPGNVRELQARVKHLLIAGTHDIKRMIALAEQLDSERERLVKALEVCGWNRSKAARLLGVNEATIRRRIAKYGLEQSVQE